MPNGATLPLEHANGYLLCTQPRDMLRLLGTLAGEFPEMRFPRTVEQTPDGHLAVALNAYGQMKTPEGQEVSKVKYFGDMLGITSSLASAPRLASVPIRDMLQLHWNRIDPVRFRRDQHHKQRANAMGLSLHEAAIERPHYILGATTVQSARQLLDSLTRFLTPNIRICPLNHEGKALPFRYLWSVEGEISLAVLQAAERAWYGPKQQPGPIHIYYQWPWTTGVSRELLRRIDWEEDCGTLLTGPDDPLQLFVRLHPETTFAPLVSYADLSIGSAVPVELVEARTGNDVPFNVKIRLLDRPDQGENLAGRIAEIQRQIQHLHELQEHLQLSAQSATHDEMHWEPLFIYYEERPQEQVPFELQRLLVEWSDQETDLQNVCYHRIQAKALDPLNAAAGTAHLVTTSTAIGRVPARSRQLKTLSHRLSSYRPQGRGRHGCFTLLTKWAKFGLRLFVPYDRSCWKLKLYPDLPATIDSAKKLAAAFGFPEGQLHRWCAILLPKADRQVHSCLVQTQPSQDAPQTETAFRPLFDAIGWECTADVALSTQSLPVRKSERAVSVIENALTREIQQAVETEIHTAMLALETDLQRCREELAVRQESIASIQAVLQDIGGLHAASVQRINDLVRLLGTRELNQITNTLKTDLATQEKIQLAIRELEAAIQSTNELKQRCQTLQQEIQSESQRN